MTIVDELQGQPKWRELVLLLLRFLGLATGLCAVFALVVTAALAWVEHAQAQWPEVTARVQSCSVNPYTYQSEAYLIACSISSVVRGEEIMSHVRSRSMPAPPRVGWQTRRVNLTNCKSGRMSIPGERRSWCITIPRTTSGQSW